MIGLLFGVDQFLLVNVQPKTVIITVFGCNQKNSLRYRLFYTLHTKQPFLNVSIRMYNGSSSLFEIFRIYINISSPNSHPLPYFTKRTASNAALQNSIHRPADGYVWCVVVLHNYHIFLSFIQLFTPTTHIHTFTKPNPLLQCSRSFIQIHGGAKVNPIHPSLQWRSLFLLSIAMRIQTLVCSKHVRFICVFVCS